ncbi:uncharacterized protein LOC116139758 [Pistacia vera]|uniref:uncharacterized protein LOC116139758 n=1 Tax=Pistacia vera TaxID=55513 RepID=UPI001262CB56|nr:uncharacterized protein LOC116139758 [Pistacia vera]
MSSKNGIKFIKIQQNLQHLTLGKLCKFIAISGLVLFLFYIFILNHFHNHSSNHLALSKFIWPSNSSNVTNSNSTSKIAPSPPTNISHIVFGIAGSLNGWKLRKPYIESWWQENVTRGYLFLDIPPTDEFLPWPSSSPPFRINEDISRLKSYAKIRKKFQVRVFRTILEVFKAENKDVRWYVMTDDDTILFVDNLVNVLAKYDHTQNLYIGTNSECITSNLFASFGMAFGGAGIALSYPLAKQLVGKIDECLARYQNLYASDFMLYSCLTDLGVALTPQKGFHQIDLHNDISGFLSAHPQSPVLSLHHIDSVNPIFPTLSRSESVNHLMKVAKVDSSRLLQQTICYRKQTNWSFSVSWGYSTHIYEMIYPRNVLVKPLQTFSPWRKNDRPPLFMFDTRDVKNNSCETPHVFFFESVKNSTGNRVVTTYSRVLPRNLPPCSTSGNHSADFIKKIQVFSPSTTLKEEGKIECCDIEETTETTVTDVKLRACREDEII